MTRAEAVSTGQNAATRFGKVFTVYRLPLWPVGVFGVTAADLPREAEKFERLAPGGNARTPPPSGEKPGQAGLFDLIASELIEPEDVESWDI
jgi:hypothetical protein